MKYYMAPMEGITTAIYRTAYDSCFGPMDKYFTPFLVPHLHKDFNTKERRDILPEYNEGLYVVPQILTNQSEDFIRTAKLLQQYGYQEVNLNLGCPSKTVVSKGRGAGFLGDLEKLERFLDDIFEKLDIKISVKSRSGLMEHEELFELMELYNDFPFTEVILHPRTQREFYKGKASREDYQEACRLTVNPICYNGDLRTVQDCEQIEAVFPGTQAVMVGRGLLSRPYFISESRKNLEREAASPKEENRWHRLEKFHHQVYEAYCEAYDRDEKNVLFKMKEIWSYELESFPNSEKIGKKIKKAVHLLEYEKLVSHLFLSMAPYS
ncbi:MAG: tRNA-dihydrouridine synthase family protein [Lachnospiraceae bacterium]|nr:tRNA-dihydrouridine synthase family protein [Lachnospiraceae bacterium]